MSYWWFHLNFILNQQFNLTIILLILNYFLCNHMKYLAITNKYILFFQIYSNNPYTFTKILNYQLIKSNLQLCYINLNNIPF
jgi:hypothetical protein